MYNARSEGGGWMDGQVEVYRGNWGMTVYRVGYTSPTTLFPYHTTRALLPHRTSPR